VARFLSGAGVAAVTTDMRLIAGILESLTTIAAALAA
jgi:hypothetical protein